MYADQFAEKYAANTPHRFIGTPYARLEDSALELGSFVMEGLRTGGNADRSLLQSYSDMLDTSASNITTRYFRLINSFSLLEEPAPQSTLEMQTGAVSLHRFHLLSIYFSQLYDRLHESSTKMTYNDYTSIQQELAFTSVLHLIHQRDSQASPKRNRSIIDGLYNGAMTELDVGVVLCEIAKRRRGTLIIASPPQFENGPRKGNSDFIVFDTSTNRAVGVQAKTSTSQNTFDSYDKERVVIVDSGHDLYDTIAQKVPGTTKTRIVRTPGLLSAHVLLSTKPNSRFSKELMAIVGPTHMMYLKNFVQSNFRHIKSKVPDAVAHVEHRLAPHLGW